MVGDDKHDKLANELARGQNTMAKIFMTGTKGVKGIDLPQYPDEAWDWIIGKPEGDTALYNSVAFLYRAINLTAGAVAAIPFAIVDEASGEDVDTSATWKNRLGFLPNPNKIIQLVEMSLIMYGQAYLFRERNRVRTLGVRYVTPTSITPLFDPALGVKGFKRMVSGEVRDLEPADLLYFWEPDPRVEIGPPLGWRMTAMLDAAGLLRWYDYFVSEFAKRGGVLPTMLMVKGIPNVQERERVENYWDRFIRGTFRVAGKIFNGDSMDVKTVGEGPGSMGDTTLTADKRSDIAVAAGIPLSLLMSNAANYATAQADRKNWYQNTVVPECNFIAGTINAQLLGQVGMRLEFRPETLDEFQEEETQRAAAWKTYVDGGMKRDIAAQVVGIEPPPGVEYDEMFENDDIPELPAPAATPAPQLPEEIDIEDNIEDAAEETPGAPTMSAQAWEDLETWRRLALKAIKKGGSPSFVFTTAEIPAGIYQTIAGGLQAAHDTETVARVFDAVISGRASQTDQTAEVKALLEGIRLGVEALNK